MSWKCWYWQHWKHSREPRPVCPRDYSSELQNLVVAKVDFLPSDLALWQDTAARPCHAATCCHRDRSSTIWTLPQVTCCHCTGAESFLLWLERQLTSIIHHHGTGVEHTAITDWSPISTAQALSLIGPPSPLHKPCHHCTGGTAQVTPAAPGPCLQKRSSESACTGVDAIASLDLEAVNSSFASDVLKVTTDMAKFGEYQMKVSAGERQKHRSGSEDEVRK